MSADIWQSAVEMATDYEIGLHVSPEDTAKALRDLADEIVRLRGGWEAMTREAGRIQLRHVDDHAGDVYHAMQAMAVKFGRNPSGPMIEPIAPAEAKGDAAQPAIRDAAAVLYRLEAGGEIRTMTVDYATPPGAQVQKTCGACHGITAPAGDALGAARSLPAKWRDDANGAAGYNYTAYEEGRIAEKRRCADELEAALRPSAGEGKEK